MLFLPLFIICVVFACSCANRSTFVEQGESLTYEIDVIKELEEKYSYLKNQSNSNLSFLVRAEWNSQGDGIRILCLNDIAEYDSGPIFEFKFEDKTVEKFRKTGEASQESQNFIDSVNEKGRNNVLKKYEIYNTLISLHFYDSTVVEFRGFYEKN